MVPADDTRDERTRPTVIPASWRMAAIRAQKESQPLAKIVDVILKLTR